MSFDKHQNLVIGRVLTAPSPAISGTTLVLQSGEGTRFPDPATYGAYNATVFPTGIMPTPSNAEIVRITARTTDTLTITRTQESSSARTIQAGDTIIGSLTAKSFTDIEDILTGTSGWPADLIPSVDNSWDLGSSAKRWQDIFGYSLNLTTGMASNLNMKGYTIYGSSTTNGTLTLDPTSGTKNSNVTNSNNVIINQARLDLRGLGSAAIDSYAQSAIFDLHPGVDQGRALINFWADDTEGYRPLSIQAHGLYADYGGGASVDRHVSIYSDMDLIGTAGKVFEWHWGDQWDDTLCFPHISTLVLNSAQGTHDANIIGSLGSSTSLNLYCTTNATVSGWIVFKNRVSQEDIYYASTAFTNKHAMQLIGAGVRDAHFSILNVVNNVAQTNNSVGLAVYSNYADTNGDLVRITQNNVDASNTMLAILNAGSGNDIEAPNFTLKNGAITALTYNTLTLTGGTNTFSIAKGTASLDIAAGKVLDINDNLTVTAGYGITLTIEDAASTITLDEQTFEVEGEGTASQLTKIVNAQNAAATLTLEGTASVINQDLTTDATPTLAGLIITNAGALKTFTTAGHTLLLQAYDTNLTGYVTFVTLTANDTPTCVLSGDVTGTTQTPGDNSTKLATTAFVTAAIATTDTLAEVLAIGNTTGATNIVVSDTQAINTPLVDDDYFTIGAVDNDTNLIVEVARVQGATEAYFSTGTSQQFKFYSSGTALFGSLVTSDAATIEIGAGGVIKSGSTNADTMLLAANDTTFITFTTGATDLCDLASGVTIGSAYIYRGGGTDVSVADGGTGASTLTDGGLLVGAGTGAIEVLAVGLTTQILVGGGAGTNPAWGTDLPTAVTIGSAYIYRVSGTDVAIADGGTALSTVAAGSILAANTIDTISAITSTTGLKILQISGTTVSWNATTGTGNSVMATNPTLSGLTLTDATDIVLNTTTGSKIGTGATQKLGFWNATPVIQSTGWAVSNVTSDKVFDANATSLDEISDVLGTLITWLLNCGLVGA